VALAARQPAGDHLGDRLRCHGLDGLEYLWIQSHADAGVLGLADLLGHAPLQRDRLLYGLVSEANGLEHLVLWKLVGAGLDHQHGLCRAGHRQIQGALLHLGQQRVDHELVVNVRYLDAGRRASEGNVRDGQCSRGSDVRKRFQVVLLVSSKRRDDDLYVVPIAFREERPQRPIHRATQQNCVGRRPPLALEEAARDLARCVTPLLKLDGEREKVNALPRRTGSRGGHQHHRIPHAHGDCAAGLLRQLARAEDDLAVSQPSCVLPLHVSSPPCLRWGS